MKLGEGYQQIFVRNFELILNLMFEYDFNLRKVSHYNIGTKALNKRHWNRYKICKTFKWSKKCSYRNTGTGNDCAGHSKAILPVSGIFNRFKSSGEVTFGLTLPTGSKYTIHHKWIRKIFKSTDSLNRTQF